MADYKSKSFAGQIELLMETEQDFPKTFKQRLVFESSKVKNPFKFMARLFSKGVLCDGSDESEASFGLKETMVQLALIIVCSQGAGAVRGLMEALEESGNSELVCSLMTWVMKNFTIGTDGDLSGAKGNDSAVQTPAPEMMTKPLTKPSELSSSGSKLIDKLMSQEGKDLMEQLEAHLLGKVSEVVNADELCSSLVKLSVLDESYKQLEPGQELEAEQWTEKGIKAACSKKAIGSLVVAFQQSDNESIIQETSDWLETPKFRKKNYPISVKSLASQQSKEESNAAVRSTFFEQAALPHELSKLAQFNCPPKSATKGTTGVQFDKNKMLACSADGTLNLWNWQSSEEEPINIAVKVKNITSFQYDEEILVLGTAEGTVHLFDATTLEEKWSVRLGNPVQSLKFVQSTLVVLTRDVDYDHFWWIDISRSDMRLLHQRSPVKWANPAKKGFELDTEYSYLYSPTNTAYVHSTKSGNPTKDDKNKCCWLEAPAGIKTLKLVDFISTKRYVVAGCKSGDIAMWDTCSFVEKQSPIKTLKGHVEAVVSLCVLKEHLLSLDQNGKLLMWSGYDLENQSLSKPIPRALAENFSYGTALVAHERWFASCSSEDGIVNIWTLPDLWLRTG